MMREFLAWWVAQLVSLLPQKGAGTARHAVVSVVSALVASPVVVEVSAAPGRRTLPAQRLVLAEAGLARLRDLAGQAPRTAWRLRLPAGVLLEREVVLPLAAERAPAQVLQYELDRLTPFRAEDAFWGWEITQRDRANGRLHVRLTLAPRTVLAPLLQTLRSAGVIPAELEAPAGAGWRRIAMQPAPAGRRPLRWVARGACAALALAVIVVPFVRQAAARAEVDAQIAALARPVAEATALRRSLSAAAASGDVWQAARLRVGDPLHALAAVTAALPDDTWLSDLTLRQRRLTLSGQSVAAVRLIERLSADPAIRNPAFSAPVTHNDASHTDIFSIGAELAP